jgi:hypothetical protein
MQTRNKISLLAFVLLVLTLPLKVTAQNEADFANFLKAAKWMHQN